MMVAAIADTDALSEKVTTGEPTICSSSIQISDETRKEHPLRLFGLEPPQDLVDLIYGAADKKMPFWKFPDEQLVSVLEREELIEQILAILSAHRYSKRFREIAFGGQSRLTYLLGQFGRRFPARVTEIVDSMVAMYSGDNYNWARLFYDLTNLICSLEYAPESFLPHLAANIDNDLNIGWTAQRALVRSGDAGRTLLKQRLDKGDFEWAGGIHELSILEPVYLTSNTELRKKVAAQAGRHPLFFGGCPIRNQLAAAAFGPAIWPELMNYYLSQSEQSDRGGIPFALAFIGEIDDLIERWATSYSSRDRLVVVLETIALLAQPVPYIRGSNYKFCGLCPRWNPKWDLGNSADWVISQASSKEQKVRREACVTLYQLISNRKLSSEQLAEVRKLLPQLPNLVDPVEQSYLMAIVHGLAKINNQKQDEVSVLLHAIYHSLNIRYAAGLMFSETGCNFNVNHNRIPGFQGGFYISCRPNGIENAMAQLGWACRTGNESPDVVTLFDILRQTYGATRERELVALSVVGTEAAKSK